MDYKRITMYNRLRDYFIPAAVLDEIFQSHKDITTLENAYDSLIQDGFSEDGAAEKIAKLVFEETGIEPDYGIDEEE
ncbi:hypothetical protein N9E12_00980 [Candidatus Marinimicrobia bacterium]|nr:hypothetical protein [Candidatus Neomarinimicrobiota bacterium]|tara:strand:+ start:136 stop:366 length:231 start_codon:yes stop_codon:yes gene_type:complete